MESVVFEIVLCASIYGFLITFIFVTKKKQTNSKRNDSNDDDGEGGLPINLPPDFDLPPGICLPDDPILKKVEEPEESFA